MPRHQMTEGHPVPGEDLLEEILSAYPDKAKQDRRQHLKLHPESQADCQSGCGVRSNSPTVPGVMTSRGCAFAGSKGVVWGPIRDVVNISHGPVGCGQYSWGTRRNLAGGKPGVDNFVPFQFTTDYQEKDIIFGGDKKLEQAIREVRELFPGLKAISIQSECPVGLIGDDVESVAKSLSAEFDLPIIPVRCEGFRGISQSLGHHIANDALRDHVIGTGSLPDPGPFDVNYFGDYNIGGDGWASVKTLEEVGCRVISTWTGDGQIERLARAHLAKLNIIHCYRSMNYLTSELEKSYGIPGLEVNFFGPTEIRNSLRKLAAFWNDPDFTRRTEETIARHEPEMQRVIEKYRPRLEGKRVMLYVGGLRPRHIWGSFKDLGMELVGTGYEFGHEDDYQRTYDKIPKTTIIYDDVNQYELDRLVEKLQPDLVASGVKEKYVFQKMGLPFRQMHSWDYSGPYHGYEGFEIFARDMDMALNSPTWGFITPPWKEASTDDVAATGTGL